MRISEGAQIVGIILLGIVAMIAIVAITWGVQWFTAPIRGALGARESIQANGDFRLEAYTSFYNQCSSIQALEGDEDTQVALLSSLTNDNDKRIVQTNIASLEGTRAGAISRYNADSHKQWTVAQFKSRALAYELPTAPYLTFNNGTWQKGTKTVCVTN